MLPKIKMAYKTNRIGLIRKDGRREVVVSFIVFVALAIEHPLTKDLILGKGQRQNDDKQDKCLRSRVSKLIGFIKCVEDGNAGRIYRS